MSLALKSYFKLILSYRSGFFILFFLQTLLLFKQDIHSPRFLTTFTSILFVSLTFNFAFYVLVFLFRRKKEFYKNGFYTLIPSILGTGMALNFPSLYGPFEQKINSFLVTSVWPYKFMQVSLHDGNFVWLLMLGLYLGLFFIIYGYWFVRNKKHDNPDGFWKIDRQLMFLGLGVYGCISIFIFIFTHFTFVGSNYIYMENEFRYVDKMADHYEQINEQNNFSVKELHYFKNIEEVKNFYQEPAFANRMMQGQNRTDFYKTAISFINSSTEQKFPSFSLMTYQNMQRFHDWIEISDNFNFMGSTQDKMWYAELTPLDVIYKGDSHDVLRHSLLYIKKTIHGGYYVYFVQDRTFKDFHMNNIFNIFFIIFHLVYIALFIYLLRIHRKVNLNKKVIV